MDPREPIHDRAPEPDAGGSPITPGTLAASPAPRAGGPPDLLPYLAFVLSGAAGLIYEVCWIRRASLVFGSTLHALSTVLAVFFLGLALGSESFGRVSERVRRPLRLYALLEACLALLALLSLPGFTLAEDLYGHAYRAFAGHGAWLTLARFALVSMILLPPAVIMGATLPLICRQFVRSGPRIVGSVGFLYGLNTLGAAAGCAAAGLLALPTLGVSGTVALGAALSLSAAALVGGLRLSPAAPVPASLERAVAPPGAGAGLVPALLFLSGFTALAYEVLWTRFLGLVIRNTVYTYTFTLATVLLGIVLGSFLAARFFDRIAARAATFGALQALTGLTVIGSMLLPPALWRGIGAEVWVYALLMLPAAALSGASFPLGVRLLVKDPQRAGSGVGRVAALNTLGGISGSLAAGFLLLPRLGLHASLLLVTGLSLATGLTAVLALGGPRPPVRRLALAAAALALWLGLPPLLRTRLPADFLRGDSELVAYREGLVSNLSVLRQEGVEILMMDRWWQGQSTKTHQVMAAHIPMLLSPDARDILVVGLGVGQTASRFLMYDVRRLDCVEIEPAVFDLVPRYFDSAWMRDPRVRLLPEDGRSYITHTDRKYDLISLEVGQAFRPGVPAFYTVDFYRRARARLARDGALVQFVPLLALPPETIPRLLASFREVFPQCALWYNTGEVLLMGFLREGPVLDRVRLAERLAGDPVRDDLRYRYWGGEDRTVDHPEMLLGGFLCGPRGLGAWAAGARPYRDDRPELDYATARPAGELLDDLSALDSLSRHLDPVAPLLWPPVPQDTLRVIERVRLLDLGQIRAAALVRRIQRERLSWDDDAALALVERAVRACPEDGDALRLMGECLQQRGRTSEGRAWLERALRIDPQDGLARRALGWLLLDQGRAAEALPHLRVAVARRPFDSDARNGLGAALASTGDLAGARTQFAEALRLDPGNAEIAQNLQRAKAEPGGR